MENDLPTSTYIKIAIIIISLPLMIILALAYGGELINGIATAVAEITSSTHIKNIEITTQNYKEIYDIVNASTDITLQEKANFNKNYLMFGKSLIGYKVKDVIKEIKW